MTCSPPVCTPLALGRVAHPTFVWGRFHHRIQAAMLRLLTGSLLRADGKPYRRLMLNVPPQHGKSTIVSQLFPPIVFAQNPAAKLILLSATSELAGDHSLLARQHVAEFGRLLNPALALAPDVKARCHWRTSAGGRFIAAGINGTVNGRSADGIIVDDYLKNSEEAASVTMRERIWQTFASVAETRLSPNGWAVIVATRWHSDDLCGRLLETEPEKWYQVSFPAFAQEGDPLGRAPGEVLFPERYSEEWYKERRATYEMKALGHLWAALYECAPTGDPSLKAFSDPSYFGPHIWADELPVGPRNAPVHRILALDPAHAKASKVSDYSAFADLTLMSDRHIYADMTLIREPLPALYARAVAIVKHAQDEGRPFRAMLIEVNGAQEAIAFAINERLQQAGITLHIDLHTTGSKEEKNARIVTGLGPLLAQRRFHFLGQSVGNRLTVKQLGELPNGAHDDGPDACELGVQLLNLLVTGQKRPPPTVLRA